ncbi:MAG: PIN domain-containing protein [Promethearchaeota archaeon]
MIPLVIDSNILFSAFYNIKGLERRLLDLLIEKDEIQLFAPDIFWDEIKRNLIKKLGYNKDTINVLISKFSIIKVSQEKYNEYINRAKELIPHEEDFPFIATSLFLNCPIWSGNKKHFKCLENSKEIIWFNSRRLLNYLKEKGFTHRYNE